MFPLLTLAMLAGAAPDDGCIIIAQLNRGQELLYDGQCEVTARGPGVDTRKLSHLRCRAYVLDTTADKAEVAIMTTARDPNAADAATTNLSIYEVSYLGLISAGPSPPLDAVPTHDAPLVVPLPGAPLRAGSRWESNEADRPPRAWTAIGDDEVGGVRCRKIMGEQVTPGWNEIGTHRAWRRRDEVWLDPRAGIARQVERTIELRDPSRREVSIRVVTTWRLESVMTYPGRLDAERRAEINLARQIERSLAESRTPRTLDALQRRLDHHIGALPASAYRDAVLAAGKKIEAARRGEVQLVAADAEGEQEIALGKIAPEFVARDLATGQPARLGRTTNRPTILLFIRPDSHLAHAALSAAAEMRDRAAVSCLCVTDDASTALRMARTFQLTAFDGREARARYAPYATPRFVVLDGDGVIRLIVDGFGAEVPTLLRRAVDSGDFSR